MKKPSKRNPIARDLRSPKYKPRVVKSKRVYKRAVAVRAARTGDRGRS